MHTPRTHNPPSSELSSTTVATALFGLQVNPGSLRANPGLSLLLGVLLSMGLGLDVAEAQPHGAGGDPALEKEERGALVLPAALAPLFEEGRTWTLALDEALRPGGGVPKRRRWRQRCRVERVWRHRDVVASRIRCDTTLSGPGPSLNDAPAPWRPDLSLEGLYIATHQGLYLPSPFSDEPGPDADPGQAKLLALFKKRQHEHGALLAPLPLKAQQDMSPMGGTRTWPTRIQTPKGMRRAWCTMARDNNDGYLRQWCFSPGLGPVQGRFTIVDINPLSPDPQNPGIAMYRYTSRWLGP